VKFKFEVRTCCFKKLLKLWLSITLRCLLFFGVKICPKFEDDENISAKLSAETEFCRIDPSRRRSDTTFGTRTERPPPTGLHSRLPWSLAVTSQVHFRWGATPRPVSSPQARGPPRRPRHRPGTDVMILKIFSPKKSKKIWHFLFRMLLIFIKLGSYVTLVD
jgi:hypothetical protein